VRRRQASSGTAAQIANPQCLGRPAETKVVNGVTQVSRKDEGRFSNPDDLLSQIHVDTYAGKGVKGLIVRNVDANLAKTLGIAAGEVLIELNGRGVRSRSEALESAKVTTGAASDVRHQVAGNGAVIERTLSGTGPLIAGPEFWSRAHSLDGAQPTWCTRVPMHDAMVGLLTVACGNSTLDCLRHDDRARVRLDARRSRPGPPRRAFLRERPLVRCVACSVVPNGLHVVAALLAPAKVPLLQAGLDLPCPLPLAHETPADARRRIGGWRRSRRRRHGRAVVVDCGSATTVNLVEADGTFHGSAIAPGPARLTAGLRAVTPALPVPRLDAVPSVPSRSSQDAVDTGRPARLLRARRAPRRRHAACGFGPRPCRRHGRQQRNDCAVSRVSGPTMNRTSCTRACDFWQGGTA
jgi:type III pantothenate kinase